MEPFFGMVEAGRIRVVTSVITLVEVLVHPLRRGDTKLAQEYREVLLGSRGFQTLPVSAEVGELAARLRAVHSLRVPDAIQLATASHAGCAAFLTNDTALPRLVTVG